MTSSTAGHTAGPWMAAARPSSVVGLPVVSQSGRSIASVTHFNLGEHFDKHDQESRSNARLIAAAPELLAFAQSIIDADSEGHMFPKWMAETARAAIAKATGAA